jgi:hypothetical protein
MCANQVVAGFDEEYWADGTAAVPVLLIDEATEAITEALHRIRCGSVLEQRDVGAAGVALGDLLGALSQLAELWTTTVCQGAGTDPLDSGSLQQRWHTLRMMMLSAQQVAEQLEGENTAILVGGGKERIPLPRTRHNETKRLSSCPPLRVLEYG